MLLKSSHLVPNITYHQIPKDPTWSLTEVITPLSLQSTDCGRSSSRRPCRRSIWDKRRFSITKIAFILDPRQYVKKRHPLREKHFLFTGISEFCRSFFPTCPLKVVQVERDFVPHRRSGGSWQPPAGVLGDELFPMNGVNHFSADSNNGKV